MLGREKMTGGKWLLLKVWHAVLVCCLLNFPGLAYAQSTTATPVFSPASRQSVVAFTVTVSSTTPGATIYYTTDGTTPTTSSSSVASGGTITVSESETVTAMAVAPGYTNSLSATGTYWITGTVAGGANHAVALKTDGTVWTWGLNSNGQLGIGNTTQQINPVRVTSLSGVVAVAAGTYHTLALKSDGTVWAWGINSNGALGDGTTTQRTSPVKVNGLTNVIAISAGAYHSIALKSDGTVWAWGSNSNGQLGDGTTTQRNAPVQVSGLTGIASIAAGDYHDVAVDATGNMYAWGYNNYGQLGDGTTTQQTTPEQITALSGVISVAAGSYHSVALTAGGNVKTWGYNGHGELGDGTLTQRNSPVQIANFSSVTRVCAGNYHNMAIKSDGTPWSWGYNWYGQCGIGSVNYVATPVQMGGVSHVAGLGAGNYFSFAISSTGNLWSCGYNYYGQLGNGAPDQHANAIQAQSLAFITALSANGVHSLALDTAGVVWAFGQNGVGQLGTNTTVQYSSPQSVLTGIKAIANGQFHSVALKNDQTVVTWGEGYYGELGDGTGRQRSSPTAVAGLSGVTAISANYRQTLALKNDGTVWAWGSNTNGQMGDGTTTQRNSPVQVTGLTGVTIKAVAEGQYHSLALDSNGQVWAWGSNSNGQIGDGTTTEHHSPVQVTGLNGVTITAISAGQGHSLALDTNGNVWVWGNNTNGQLGDGSTTQRISPFKLTSLSGITAISAGETISVVLKNDKTVWAWGQNNYSQLGDGTTTQRTSPVQLPGLSGVTALAAGVGHSLVLKEDGTVAGWGANSWNDLGTGLNETQFLQVSGFNLLVGVPVPAIAITTPANNATVPLGQSQNFTASASETGGTIANVSYYIGSTLVGQSTTGPSYSISWTPASWGNYIFTAIATDANGNASAYSAPVTVQVPYDSDGNGLPDWWELKYFGHLGNSATADSDGDGLTNAQEYQQGGDPTNYYSQGGGPLISPTLTIYSGNNQISSQNKFTPDPLTVRVIGGNGSPLVNAPVVFAVVSGGGQVATSTASATSPNLTAYTDANGYASVYYLQPTGTVTSTITAATAGLSVSFTETSNPNAATPTITPGGGYYASAQTVTVTTTTPDATIYYTTDGTDPVTTSASVASGGTISVASTEPLKVKAYASSYLPSATSLALYRISSVTGEVVAGKDHIIALKADGTVWSWGDNTFGQLGNGDGSGSPQYIPKQIAGLSGIVAVAAGDYHSMALKSDGTVWAWGYNAEGELGQGNTSGPHTTPVQVMGLSGITAIAAGAYHTLAVKNNGTVWGWGYSSLGELGPGAVFNRITPAQIAGLSGVVAVSAGADHSVVLKSDGTVWAWGYNNEGELGQGVASSPQLTPAQVTALSGVTAITAGGWHTAAIKGNGTVWAWGYNNYGQAGDGTTANHLSPVQVTGLSGIKEIDGGLFHTVAVRNDGTVWTWGYNGAGELGNGDATGVSKLTPIQATGVNGATSASAGNYFTAILKNDGTVWTWGDSGAGQLAKQIGSQCMSPVKIVGMTGIKAIAGGKYHTVALKNDGTVWAWGYNAEGELGQGNTSAPQFTPIQITGLNGVTALAAGASHALAVKNDGTVWAWGYNNFGQLGDGTMVNHSTAEQITGLSGVVAVSAGVGHSVALKNDGTVSAWGYNTEGELGQGNTSGPHTTPVQVTTLSDVTTIVAGSYHTLALKNDGTVWGWGYGNFGELGAGTGANHVTPGQITSLSGVVAVSAGEDDSMALKSDGTVWAWGYNNEGELGQGVTGDPQSTPVQVTALSGMTAIATGNYYTLALKNDGTVWGWGINDSGELGDGTTISRNIPVSVFGLDHVTTVATGAYHAIALRNDGTVWAWGSNQFGKLGVGSNVNFVPNQELGLYLSHPAPVVSITSPSASSTIFLGQSTTFQVSANAAVGGGAVTEVDYYNGTTQIGSSTTAPFSFTWTPTTPGSFDVTAVALDDNGVASVWSNIVTVNVTVDSDSNGLADSWEMQYFGHLGNDPNSSPNGNGLTLLQDYQQGNDPTNYYSQSGTIVVPAITITGGNNQTSAAGSVAPQALTVKVTNSTGGAPLVNAPVSFIIFSGGGQVAISSSSTADSSLQTTTDTNGIAQAYYVQPSGLNIAGVITANTSDKSVSFNETSIGVAAAPTFSLDAGTYLGAQTMTLTSATSGATIYYTTDGTTPTTLSPSVSNGGSITIAQSSVVQAMAVVLGYDNSLVSFAAYVITQPPPAAPSDLTVAGTSVGELDLNWTNHATDATSVLVQQSTDGGATWTTVATLGSGVTSYAATGLDTGIAYQFQVLASNGNGTSTGTNSGGGIHPPTTPQAPGAPTSLTGVTSDNPHGMSLSWPAVAGASSYLVERQYLATGEWETLATVSDTTYLDTTYAGAGFHYRVSAISSDGTSSPSNEWPQSRYAVIDLGANVSPMKITNSGYILAITIDPNTGSIGYVRWYNGTLTTLNPGTSAYSPPTSPSSPVPPYWGDLSYVEPFSSPNAVVATDIGESGTVHGVQDWESIHYHSYMTDWGSDGADGFTEGFTGIDLYTSGYMCRATWGPGADTATTATVANSTAWNAPGICGVNTEGISGWPMMDAGTALIGTDAATYSIESAKGSGDGNYYLFDLFKNGGDQSKQVKILGATNNSGDILAGYPGATYPYESNYLNNAAVPANFWANGISNRSVSGHGLIVAGNNVTIAPSFGNPAWWDGYSGAIHLLSTGGGFAAHANAATVSVTSNGSTTQQPAPQIVGGDSLGSVLWEMDPATGQFGSALHVADLIGSGSQWAYVDGTNLNDNGAIVGTATYSGTNTAIASGSHGIMLCPCAVVSDPSNTYLANENSPTLTYVRFGLWDNAFTTTGSVTVLNGNSENGNFVGSDSRRFYIRVYDPSATTTTVTADWYTKKSDGTDEDHPATDTITLTRSATNPAFYVSKALMLVADEVDNAQVTNTGLSGGGNAAEGAADHRLRRAALGDTMCYAYTPAAANSAKSTFTVPIFNPSSDSSQPDTVKNLTVQFVKATGGLHNANTVNQTIVDNMVTNVKARYAVAGINVTCNYTDAVDSISVPTSIDLGAVNPGSAAPSTGDEAVMIQLLRAKYGAYTSANTTVYVIVLGEFTTPSLSGESYPAFISGTYPNAVNCCFVTQLNTRPGNIVVEPHEIGHVLLERVTADGGPDGQGHYEGLSFGQNMMCAGATDTGSDTQSKRLWNDPAHNDGVHDYQIDYMRLSPLLH